MNKSSLLAVIFAVSSIMLCPALLLANPSGVVWHDDMEGNVSGWASADFTAGDVPHFHWDWYMAYEGASWWCGTFDYDADGGYGNGWDDRLELPEIPVNPVPVENITWAALKSLYRDGSQGSRGGRARDAIVPILTFVYRCDSENTYDYTYVEAKRDGSFERVNFGYDHRVPWTDLGEYGFDLSEYDDPLEVRFRFVSDGAWSDEDGLYNSVGGAFAVDNIKVYDFATGEVLFYDSEPGLREGECIPSVPAAAGDYWHLIDRACPAYSDPHSWWCGDDSDTSLVPPNLRNGLFSPVVDLAGTQVCTAFFAMHFAIPTPDDFIQLYGTTGGDYYGLVAYWGDFGSCSGWSTTAFNRGFDLGQFAGPYDYQAGMLFIMNTNYNGCGPGAAGDAGVMLDDLWLCTLGEDPWGDRREGDLYYAEPYPGASKIAGAPLELKHR